MESTMVRTDSHRPVSLVTEDYDYVDSLDLTPPSPIIVGPNANGQYMTIEAETAAQRARRRQLLDLIAASPEHRDTGKCDHCGAHVRYIAIMRYLPTGNVITVGETCLENRFSRATGEFQALRKQAALDRAQHRIRKAVAAFVEANPDLAWMANLESSWQMVGLAADGGEQRGVRPNWFVLDISHRLRKYGELSEKQIAAVRTSVARDAQYRAERAAKQAAEATAHPTSPVVEGKIEITGEVLSTKYVESQYGSTLKMLVRDDRGFKVFGSVPASLGQPDNGTRVQFTATVERSRDDENFGFYKNPSRNARVLEGGK